MTSRWYVKLLEKITYQIWLSIPQLSVKNISKYSDSSSSFLSFFVSLSIVERTENYTRSIDKDR